MDVRMDIIPEQDEQNIVMVALFAAINDCNLQGVKDLLKHATAFNINYSNKSGESALHLASKVGSLTIVKFLQSIDINSQAIDKAGENAIFAAVRFNHIEIVKYFCETNLPINNQNKVGESALHVASQMGHTEVVEYLCTSGANICLPDKNGETPLHYACYRGYIETVKALLFSNSSAVDVLDKKRTSALHVACKKRHVAISMLLINEGAQIQVKDINGDTALHIAAKEGLYVVVQSLCSLGCDLDATNKSGNTAMHLAARWGRTEVVRLLLLAGSACDSPQNCSNSLSAELMALSQGHNETAELLSKLKADNLDCYCRQLSVTNIPLKRIKLKVFGALSSGKSTLISSLKCTYLGSFFRKNRLSQADAINPTSTPSNNNNHKEEDISNAMNNVLLQKSTKGIDVQQISLSHAGEFSSWEFSGDPRYFSVYDHFIGDPNCLHIVCFNIMDPLEKQQQDVLFWLRFIQSRIAPMEPIGKKGRHPTPTRVTLVATHSDLLNNNILNDTKQRVNEMSLSLKERFSLTLDISNKSFLLDGQLAMHAEMKLLRQHLSNQKASVKNLPFTTGFFEATVAALPLWRKVTCSCPVVSWCSFVEYVRRQVNLLAGEEHLRTLMCQLQLSGEIVYMETESERDLVILSPQWLCSTLIGRLLSIAIDEICPMDTSDTKHVDHISSSMLNTLFPQSIDDISDVIRVIESLDLCYRCIVSVDEDCLDIDVPALNHCDKSTNLWRSNNRGNNELLIYGGLELRCVDDTMALQIEHIFSKIIVQLRRDLSPQGHSMRHWRYGASLPTGDGMQCQVSYLINGSRGVEIRCRGTSSLATELYYLLDDVRCMAEHVIGDACPGIALQRHILSAKDMRAHRPMITRYSPIDIFIMQEKNITFLQKAKSRSSSVNSQISTEFAIAEDDIDEGDDFYDSVCFGCQHIASVLQMGLDLHMSYLSLPARRHLSIMLDDEDSMGRDWCMLAVKLGLEVYLPQLHREIEIKQKSISPTDRIIQQWSNSDNATIGKLLSTLKQLHRMDVAKVLQEYALPWHIYIGEDGQTSAVEDLISEVKDDVTNTITSYSSSSDPSR